MRLASQYFYTAFDCLCGDTQKGVSSGVYTPVSIVCAAIAAFIAGLFSVIPIRKNGLLLGLCSSVLLIACVVVSAAAQAAVLA